MKRKFISYIETSKYNIGISETYLYFYDKNENEIKKCYDIHYAYRGIVSPKEDLFALKSTDGYLAIYSLDTLELMAKIDSSDVDGSQDDNFIFSPDGKFLLNIERHINSLITRLSIYDMSNFKLYKRLFDTNDNLVLSLIEFDKKTDTYFILGFERMSNTGENTHFVSKLENDELVEIKYISKEVHLNYIISKNENLVYPSFLLKLLFKNRNSFKSLYEMWAKS